MIDKTLSLNKKIEHEDIEKEDHTERNSSIGANKARFSQSYYSWETALSTLGCCTVGRSNRYREEDLGLG